jgi:hypothetical protein
LCVLSRDWGVVVNYPFFRVDVLIILRVLVGSSLLVVYIIVVLGKVNFFVVPLG